MELSKIDTGILQNDRYFQFHTEVNSLILITGPDALKVGALYQAFRAAYVRVYEVLKIIRRNDICCELTDSRSDESAAKVVVVLREARAELDSVYLAITKHIAALVEAEGPGAYEQFIKKHNDIVKKKAQANGTGALSP